LQAIIGQGENRLMHPEELGTLTNAMNALLADPQCLQFHVDQLRINGFTVFENAISPEFVADLRDHPELPFSFPMLYEHPAVLAVAEAVMGPQLVLSYLSFDAGLPGAREDVVHSDSRLLFPEAYLPTPAFGLVVGVPLADVTEESGATEIWPGGTHHMPCLMEVQQHAPAMTSLRVTMKAGGVMLRDLRTWHRAMPNRTSEPCPKFTLVYTRPWYRLDYVKPPTIAARQLERLSDRARETLRYADVVEE
jgi:ectoine hydroxylase-related dioxygenase (phytanoyl-CoA dioxygenase family)